jgi:hypothetical protein
MAKSCALAVVDVDVAEALETDELDDFDVSPSTFCFDDEEHAISRTLHNAPIKTRFICGAPSRR